MATAAVLLGRHAAVNAHEKDGRTPLHSAASQGRQEAAALLLNESAAVDVQDSGEKALVHFSF